MAFHDWAVLCLLICMVHLFVCSCHVTGMFQSESTLFRCLNVKKLLTWSTREIWSLSECNWTWTHNHLVHKPTLNHLAKVPKQIVSLFISKQKVFYRRYFKRCCNNVWLNGWVFVYEIDGRGFESSCSHLNFRFFACFEQGAPWHSVNYGVWTHSETRTWHDKNILFIHKYLGFFYHFYC